jgi:hypothetical protein
MGGKLPRRLITGLHDQYRRGAFGVPRCNRRPDAANPARQWVRHPLATRTCSASDVIPHALS